MKEPIRALYLIENVSTWLHQAPHPLKIYEKPQPGRIEWGDLSASE